MAFRIVHEPIFDSPRLPYGSEAPTLPETTEWITPTGWTAEEAQASFERRNPNSRVLSCVPLAAADLPRRRLYAA